MSAEACSNCKWKTRFNQETMLTCRHPEVEENHRKFCRRLGVPSTFEHARQMHCHGALFEARKEFEVYENQLTLLIETDNKEEAVKTMKEAHTKAPEKYHELFQLLDGRYIGVRQYAPNDPVDKW